MTECGEWLVQQEFEDDPSCAQFVRTIAGKAWKAGAKAATAATKKRCAKVAQGKAPLMPNPKLEPLAAMAFSIAKAIRELPDA